VSQPTDTTSSAIGLVDRISRFRWSGFGYDNVMVNRHLPSKWEHFRTPERIRPVPGAVPGGLCFPLVQVRQADWPVGVVCGQAGHRRRKARVSPIQSRSRISMALCLKWIAVDCLPKRRPPRSAVSKYWRAHAQATSECVQPSSGSFSH
jgi:hypothetical protein